jgi:patatin-related protein
MTTPAGPLVHDYSVDTQEVRFATAMTGGVSLAIWMGGVARELDLLLQASRWRKAMAEPSNPHASVSLYGKLLSFMDVVVETDVLSGTSAGGINGVLLAIARVRGRDLGELRNIWMDIASLQTLIREPGDSEIRSLLYGDEQMFDQIYKRIGALPAANLPAGDAPPTTLYVTTTLMTGESGWFTDSFGTAVQDTDQRGVFTFDTDELASSENDEALALAARSTASFPGAFEPSYLPYRQSVPATGSVPRRPPMGGFIGITRDHWVADGGLLNNRPINLVVDDIFRRSASGPVRRVLLYVVPSTGPTPNAAHAAPQDSVAAPYGVADGVFKEITSRMNASIAAELVAIQRHNDDIDARSDLRLWIMDKHGPDTDRLLTPDSLSAFGGQFANRVGVQISRAMLKLLSTWAPEGTGDAVDTVPAAWEKYLGPRGGAEYAIRNAVDKLVLAQYEPAQSGLPGTSPNCATYGRAAFDNGVSMAIEVLRGAETFADAEDRKVISDLVGNVHDIAALAQVVPLDALTFEACADAQLRTGEIGEAAASVAASYLKSLAVPETAWLDLAKVLVRAAKRLPYLNAQELEGITADVAGHTERDAAARLQSYVGYLRLGATPQVVMQRLFDLAVTERSLLPADAGPHQRIDLVQVSADTSCALAPERSTAQQKLTGMQLHHFGAFYKKSWRVNDWMWGRLDGAGWLVHVLLDPKRVRHLVETNPRPEGTTASQWLFETLATTFAADVGAAPDAEVLAELQFLDDPNSLTPLSLARTATWLAQAWQRGVAEEELPVLASTIVNKDEHVDKSGAASVAWAKQVQKPGADLPALLAPCPVSNETFKTDMGTPLMLSTVSKAVATAAGAVDTVHQIPAVLRPPIKTTRTVTLAGYRVVKQFKGVATWVIIAGLLVLLAGLGLQAAGTEVAGGSPLLVAGIGGYLVVLGVWQVSFRALGALLAMTITLALVWLSSGAGRHKLFGKPGTKDVGVLGRHEQWVAERWWHPLAVLGVVLLAVTIYELVLSRVPRLTANAGRWLRKRL